MTTGQLAAFAGLVGLYCLITVGVGFTLARTCLLLVAQQRWHT